MAKFSPQQAAAILAVQQVINEWASELDLNNGLSMGPLLTEDCVYTVRAIPRHGRAAVMQFYAERYAELGGTPESTPTQRHLLSNFRTSFPAEDHAVVKFQLLYFAAPGTPPIITLNLPTAVADVSMECRCGSDGEWLIARFDSAQSFIRG